MKGYVFIFFGFFSNMTEVYDKIDAIMMVKSILEREKPSSILLVRGNDSYEECGARGFIEPQLNGYKVTSLSGFKKSPYIGDIKNTIDVILGKNIDFIIGVGGGTVMDISKAASVLYKEEGLLEGYIKGELKPIGNNIRRLLIPTTAGTGAEITPFSVVYIDKTKYSLAHPSMSPEYVILAPELTLTLSKKVTASTGCDALAQAIEAFWSVNATEESKRYSKEAIYLALNNLSNAVNNPNLEDRTAMLRASHLAGKAISIAKTTAAHSLSYPFTSYHDIPHGHAVMLTLPYFFEVNEYVNEENIQDKKGFTVEYARRTFDDLLKVLGVKGGAEAKVKLLDLMDDVGLERSLGKLGVNKNDFQNIVNNGFNPQRVVNNPVKITEGTVWEILEKIL